MIDFLKRIFGKKPDSPDDDIVHITNCERWISLYDPRETRNDVDLILVDGRKIRGWATRQLKNTIGGKPSARAAREFLPDWLRTIPKGSDSIVRPEQYLNAAIYSGLDYFNNKGWTKYWCHECGCWVQKIEQKAEDRTFNGETNRWTAVLACEEGHVISRREQWIKHLGVHN